MNIFSRLFSKRINKGRLSTSLREQPSIDDMDRLNSNPLRIDVHHANGGMVIETRLYDRVKDRTHSSLYVIHDSQDLGEELSKIITISGLRT